MAATLSQLEAIEISINTGALTVDYGDKKVTYRSLAEMRRIRDDIKEELYPTTASRRKYIEFSKGL